MQPAWNRRQLKSVAMHRNAARCNGAGPMCFINQADKWSPEEDVNDGDCRKVTAEEAVNCRGWWLIYHRATLLYTGMQ